jgi:hypothetical protein
MCCLAFLASAWQRGMRELLKARVQSPLAAFFFASL